MCLIENNAFFSNVVKMKANQHNVVCKVSKKYTSLVNEFIIECSKNFIDNVLKVAFQIDHYWGRIEFTPGRGQVHLHLL